MRFAQAWTFVTKLLCAVTRLVLRFVAFVFLFVAAMLRMASTRN